MATVVYLRSFVFVHVAVLYNLGPRRRKIKARKLVFKTSLPHTGVQLGAAAVCLPRPVQPLPDRGLWQSDPLRPQRSLSGRRGRQPRPFGRGRGAHKSCTNRGANRAGYGRSPRAHRLLPTHGVVSHIWGWLAAGRDGSAVLLADGTAVRGPGASYRGYQGREEPHSWFFRCC